MRVTPRVDPRKIAVAEILAPDSLGGSLLFAHHNASWQLSFERERELRAVAGSRLVEDLLGKQEISHVVLAGDFNAAPDSARVRFWQRLESLGDTSVCYRDAWESTHPEDPGHTFTPRNPLVTGGDNWPLELGRRSTTSWMRCGPPR